MILIWFYLECNSLPRWIFQLFYKHYKNFLPYWNIIKAVLKSNRSYFEKYTLGSLVIDNACYTTHKSKIFTNVLHLIFKISKNMLKRHCFKIDDIYFGILSCCVNIPIRIYIKFLKSWQKYFSCKDYELLKKDVYVYLAIIQSVFMCINKLYFKSR